MMFRWFGVLITLLCIFSNLSCGKRGGSRNEKDNSDAYSAQITLLDSVYDFGELQVREEPYGHAFRIKNTGTTPAVILHTQPSCKCTSAFYNKKPIEVGNTDSVIVYFDATKSEKGYFNKVVKVSINSTQLYTLCVKGYVK